MNKHLRLVSGGLTVALVLFPLATAHTASLHSHDEEIGESNPISVPVFLTPESISIPTSWQVPSANCPGGAPGVDTDGDGILDVNDEDDDCDFLADSLETQLLLTSATVKNTDGEGPHDGLDLKPASSILPKLRLKIKEFKNFDGGMDCCFGASWGDPFLDAAEVRLRENQGAIVTINDIPGFSSCDTCHSHDKEVYTSSDFPSADVTRDLVSDITSYTRDSSVDFPRFYIDFKIKDHDLSSHDEYDINSLANFQNAWRWTDHLEFLSNSVLRAFEQSGGGDGDTDNSGLLKIEISTDVPLCAVKAATRVASNDALVTLAEVTC